VTPGGITDDEKQRLNETLADLNRDVFGGAEALQEGGAAPAPGGTAPAGQPGSTAPAGQPGAPASVPASSP
jgi:hypothetical protein